MRNTLRGAAALLLLAIAVQPVVADVVRLDELPLTNLRQDWGKPHANQSVEANPIMIGGKTFDHGIGTHAGSSWWLELDGKAQRLTANVGFDDEVKREPRAARTALEFKVIGDHGTLWKSGAMHVGDAAKAVDVDLTGQKRVVLVVSPAAGSSIEYAHADWADAAIVFAGARPVPGQPPAEPREILTPPAPATPRITGPTVFGVRPGHPILFTVTATGERPLRVEATGLPEGVKIDADTGRLTGSVAKAGTHEIALRVSNARGKSERTLKLVVGDTLSLTPPMGWNSWYCWGLDISDAKIRAAADALISTGLADHGWSYVNIDDGWTLPAKITRKDRREPDGALRTDPKFPDMKALADYVHSKGLKIGTYSSPGEETCGGREGSLGHEAADAAQYAAWGFDLLKYDWCSYGRIADQKIRETTDAAEKRKLYQHPYIVMHEALAAQPRDIVYSLCQYGMGQVWEWGGDVGGQLWRTTGDITDSWSAMTAIGFGQNGHERYAGPGHWNDPDMLQVGTLALGELRETRLTPNEQYTQVSLWSLLSAPLLISGDVTKFDPFTLNLLTNDEVIAVNQDPLGKQGRRIARDDNNETEVWMKDLEDGSKAIGLFNRGETPATVKVTWAQLGLNGAQQPRDLWRQKDLDASDDGYSVEVPRHGAVLIKVTPKK